MCVEEEVWWRTSGELREDRQQQLNESRVNVGVVVVVVVAAKDDRNQRRGLCCGGDEGDLEECTLHSHCNIANAINMSHHHAEPHPTKRLRKAELPTRPFPS